MKRSLGQVFAPDWHGAAIDFKEEAGPVQLAGFSSPLQGKRIIGNDSELCAVPDLYPPSEGLFIGPLTFVSPKFLFTYKPNATAIAAGTFEPNHEIGNQNGVFEENRSNGTVFLTPRQLPGDWDQGGSSFVPETIYDRAGAATLVIQELRARALQISEVIEKF